MWPFNTAIVIGFPHLRALKQIYSTRHEFIPVAQAPYTIRKWLVGWLVMPLTVLPLLN